MKARKTADVIAILDRANTALAVTNPSQTGERKGVIFMLEGVLHDTGNYRGFQFTDGNRGDTDETRRRYI